VLQRVIASAVGDFSEKPRPSYGSHLVGVVRVRVPPAVQKAADRRAVKVRASRVIYHVLDELLDLLADFLPTETVEAVAAVAEVKAVYAVRKKGVAAVAGCAVIEGTFDKGASVYRVLRAGAVVHEARAVTSLQHLKERVESVTKGRECGIALDEYEGFVSGDRIEAVKLSKKKGKLEVSWA
jgi:translation initiation factor IF-2